MKVIARNRRATFDYDITDKMTAGLVLAGSEVKSVRAGHVSLKGSFIAAHDGELYLINAHINPYSFAAANHEPTRSSKLLLHKKQISLVSQALDQAGLSAVPLVIGLERGLIKLEIGIGRGKKRFDKRETTKRRELAREAERDISDKNHD